MSHKAAKPTLIVLVLAALMAVSFLATSQASAAGIDRDEAVTSNDRFPTSAKDLLPELNQLNCTPRCDGQKAACGELKTVDSCLAQSSTQGCFWSCD